MRGIRYRNSLTAVATDLEAIQLPARSIIWSIQITATFVSSAGGAAGTAVIRVGQSEAQGFNPANPPQQEGLASLQLAVGAANLSDSGFSLMQFPRGLLVNNQVWVYADASGANNILALDVTLLVE